MENNLTFQNQTLTISPRGISKLLALKSKLAIPFNHIVGATIDPGILKDFKGIRSPGTAVPGLYYAGTFYNQQEKLFFNIKTSSTPVVIQLRNEEYDRIVIGVEDPRKLVKYLNNLIYSN